MRRRSSKVSASRSRREFTDTLVLNQRAKVSTKGTADVSRHA
jgi:hypothetical protein